MAKITPRDPSGPNRIVVKTKETKQDNPMAFKWWKARTQADLSDQVMATASFLKGAQQYRYKQAGIYARLYGNMPLFNVMGGSFSKLNQTNQLPMDRPTMNVVQSCIDTLTSRITQSRPRPVFLTDNSDYRQRRLAQQLNTFINGELFQTNAYSLGELVLRDAAALGTGCVKIFESSDKRVMLERVLLTELLVDPNDAFYGDPRQLYQLKLVDREVLKAIFPEARSEISKAEQAYPDQSADSTRTVSDQVMVVEAWHLPSAKGADDGRHVIACTSGLVLDEPFTKAKFPFEFLHYSPRLVGFWGQGLSEQLMGTQVEINKLLMTISRSINLMGVPRIFIEDGSKIVKSHFNNEIGSMITYRGQMPVIEQGNSGIAADIYAQLQRLVQYAYQQSGVSALAASATKPAGLNSGEAIRNYDDLQSDRFASLSRRYDNLYIALAYQITDLAKEIVDRDGSYQTVYPNKSGVKEIDLKDAKLLDDPFVIQCFDASSLPRDPSGRLEKVTEMAQSGMIDMQEARRLLDYPDLEQSDKLASSGEERILQILDAIVEDGKYTPPDPFMDLQLATKLCTQYYNLYSAAKLEESKEEKLRMFFSQIQTLQMAAMPPATGTSAPPQAVPQAPPISPLLPNAPGQVQ